MNPFAHEAFDTGCTIEVEHTNEHFHAHVELDGNVAIYPGDKVKVHGSAIKVPFGGQISERRTATITRASAIERAWTRMRGQFEITELYEVSFSSGRIA